jgi:hypothetical protein
VNLNDHNVEVARCFPEHGSSRRKALRDGHRDSVPSEAPSDLLRCAAVILHKKNVQTAVVVALVGTRNAQSDLAGFISDLR